MRVHRTRAAGGAAVAGAVAVLAMDGRVISAPKVQESITGGRVQISGNFTAGEAKDLAKKPGG